MGVAYASTLCDSLFSWISVIFGIRGRIKVFVFYFIRSNELHSVQRSKFFSSGDFIRPNDVVILSLLNFTGCGYEIISAHNLVCSVIDFLMSVLPENFVSFPYKIRSNFTLNKSTCFKS